ncbi:PD40 domain-containing protein [Paenibacillus beijingensis]|uniref:Uncharacterized protein n=1 Tax=Paenibacillus beijingensis TaxID=1126833 RepID=A0A0D5NG98_9BACL|nr:PD40 domain-containing protein [Paenibacillus beijingensis]AJY74135.1 hypothetical protein VN24_05380 [Paenibacillus beijingensis]
MHRFETPRQGGAGLLAYTSNRGGTFEIWIYVPAAGLTYPITRGLGTEFSVPYWSPNRRRIAFIGAGSILYALDTAAGSAAQIDQIEPYTLLDWSPDSRFLTYVKDGQIVIYNVLTHTSRSILQEGAADAQWFPSGRELLFAAPDSAGISQLYRINSDGTDKQQLTQNTEGPLHNVRLSHDGRFALYTSPGVSISIISTVDLATGQTVQLEGGPLAKNYFPEWSPDDSLIAYSATAMEDNRYISLIQTDSRSGGQMKTWAQSDCFASPVSWSPDGNRIAYLSGCTIAEQASQIWLVDIRNPAPFKIVEGGRIAALQWSPPAAALPQTDRYINRQYRVSFPYPASWRKVTEERYEGADGFFQISAISSEKGIDEVCRAEAFHPLRPYGSAPRIVRANIQNQPACFIFPSADQPAEMRSQSALIVKYPKPVPIQGTVYTYFILWADRNHIVPIGQRLMFV